MNRYFAPILIDPKRMEQIVRDNPGITTPEIAEMLDLSTTIIRWAIYGCDNLEFYDGNHIRFKGTKP